MTKPRGTAPLLATGARVSSVDEEGEVSLFCFSLQRTFTFRVSPAEAKTWGQRIGSTVRVQVVDEADDPALYDCEACAAKPGMATLCSDCLRRREAAGRAWKGQHLKGANDG